MTHQQEIGKLLSKIEDVLPKAQSVNVELVPARKDQYQARLKLRLGRRNYLAKKFGPTPQQALQAAMQALFKQTERHRYNGKRKGLHLLLPRLQPA